LSRFISKNTNLLSSNLFYMKKNSKTIADFQSNKLRSMNSIIGGGGDDPNDGKGKTKPPPPPPGPLGPTPVPTGD
jgi:hypothetical protein